MHSSNLVVLSLRVDTSFDGHWSDGSTFWMLSPAFDQICWADCKVHFQFLRTIVPSPTKHLLLQPRFGAESSLESNRAFFLTLVYLKSFRYNVHYWQARTFIAFTFHVPRMQYSCSKLYLHITVTANYWPKKSAELHNARTFFCWSSLQVILQVFFLKIVIDQRAIGNYPAIQMTRSSTMFI